MSKKDDLNHELNNLNTYLGATLAAIIAIVGFTFGAAGGVIECESWLVYISAFACVLCFAGLVFLQKMINKARKEIRELK